MHPMPSMPLLSTKAFSAPGIVIPHLHAPQIVKPIHFKKAPGPWDSEPGALNQRAEAAAGSRLAEANPNSNTVNSIQKRSKTLRRNRQVEKTNSPSTVSRD